MDGAQEIAYFTMELALDDAIPTYSGGLGVLAGDYLRAAADLGLELVAVTLLYREGYFRQRVDEDGVQHEEPVDWSPEEMLERLQSRVVIEIDGREVQVAAWRLDLEGSPGGSGGRLPVYFLDTNLPGNDAAARSLTEQLYSGDDSHRLRQEAVLGLGGLAMLEELGHLPTTFHMNEGHSALLVLRLLDSEPPGIVRSKCVFTTHTPVPAGHDRFPRETVTAVLGKERTIQLEGLGCLETGELNLTELGIAGSEYVNGVSKRHGEVTREMFPGVEVASVTNGIHAATWAAPSIAAMFDRHLGKWREDNAMIRYACSIPLAEIEQAHRDEKRRLLDQVVDRAGRRLDSSALTIGLARRATPYKQATLLFSDLDRLVSIAESHGPLQVLFSGKAHPRDLEGKAMIERVVGLSADLSGPVEVVFLEQYDLRLASLLVAGTDVWLNTPVRPKEASGTSGMKAALNGVPSLSTLDGWWLEGWIEGVTGWAIGGLDDGDDAEDLYRALELSVLPKFYGQGTSFSEVRRHAIALNGSFFTTERMAREYARSAYGLSSA
ncbi:MAG: alpha-glucan family phosphorylase [Acidimicrobiales bacterium]